MLEPKNVPAIYYRIAQQTSGLRFPGGDRQSVGQPDRLLYSLKLGVFPAGIRSKALDICSIHIGLNMDQRLAETVRRVMASRSAQRTLVLLVLLAVAYLGGMQGLLKPPQQASVTSNATGSDQVLAEAFQHHARNVTVQGEGRVVRILADDTEGIEHQKFILQLASGQELLVAHNTDLAQRVDDLHKGDTVEFHGEYEWNPQGGVLHWTHHDPEGRHADGWLKHNGRVYQ